MTHITCDCCRADVTGRDHVAIRADFDDRHIHLDLCLPCWEPTYRLMTGVAGHVD